LAKARRKAAASAQKAKLAARKARNKEAQAAQLMMSLMAGRELH
jgi:hypothetical protein